LIGAFSAGKLEMNAVAPASAAAGCLPAAAAVQQPARSAKARGVSACLGSTQSFQDQAPHWVVAEHHAGPCPTGCQSRRPTVTLAVLPPTQHNAGQGVEHAAQDAAGEGALDGALGQWGGDRAVGVVQLEHSIGQVVMQVQEDLRQWAAQRGAQEGLGWGKRSKGYSAASRTHIKQQLQQEQLVGDGGGGSLHNRRSCHTAVTHTLVESKSSAVMIATSTNAPGLSEPLATPAGATMAKSTAASWKNVRNQNPEEKRGWSVSGQRAAQHSASTSAAS
jgi:hypothetical protein